MTLSGRAASDYVALQHGITMTPPLPRPSGAAQPSLGIAMARGANNRCPQCGRTKLFRGWLRPAPVCMACGTELGAVRADDAPPYFVIFAVAHLVVPLILWLEQARAPGPWVHAAIFLPLTAALCLALLRPVKGATIGLMLTFGIRGTGDG
jgi:uncharacterized protein (DUF983 family)